MRLEIENPDNLYDKNLTDPMIEFDYADAC